MKNRKTMLERLKAYRKKCGGYSAIVVLSELLWNHAYVTMAVETSSGTECGRVRVPRTMRTYRLQSARGLFMIRRVSANEFNISRVCVTPFVNDMTLRPVCDHRKRLPWEITRIGSYIPRSTANPLQTFYDLYKYARNCI